MLQTPQPALRRAQELMSEAGKDRRPCDPVRPLIEEFGLDGAYAVQEGVLAERLADAP